MPTRLSRHGCFRCRLPGLGLGNDFASAIPPADACIASVRLTAAALTLTARISLMVYVCAAVPVKSVLSPLVRMFGPTRRESMSARRLQSEFGVGCRVGSARLAIARFTSWRGIG